jgi:hypothetical protein
MQTQFASVGNWGVGVFHADIVGHCQDSCQSRFVDARYAAGFTYGGQNILGAHVADQIVSGKRAPAKSGERAIEAAAAGVVGGENFCLSVFRPAVQMSAQFDSGDVFVGTFENVADDFRVALPAVSASETVAPECLLAIREFLRPVPVPTVLRRFPKAMEI